eukprot:2164495-Prymnesium_polylepis.1
MTVVTEATGPERRGITHANMMSWLGPTWHTYNRTSVRGNTAECKRHGAAMSGVHHVTRGGRVCRRADVTSQKVPPARETAVPAHVMVTSIPGCCGCAAYPSCCRARCSIPTIPACPALLAAPSGVPPLPAGLSTSA